MNTNNQITCSLWPNINKQHEMHPDLRGKLQLDGKTLDVALWTRQTKDRTRIYHSATISEPYTKGQQQANPPLARGVKLYELRKRQDEDPDFQTPESFSLLGKDYYLALWVKVTGPDELEELSFTLTLLSRPYAEEATSHCQATLDALRERLKEREKERAEEKAYRENPAAAAPGGDPDLETEPDDIPF